MLKFYFHTKSLQTELFKLQNSYAELKRQYSKNVNFKLFFENDQRNFTLLLGSFYLIRLFSRSKYGMKFLAVIKIVNNIEIHYFLGHKNKETSRIKIIKVEIQWINNKASIYTSFSF